MSFLLLETVLRRLRQFV